MLYFVFPSKYADFAKFGEVGNLLGLDQYCEYKLYIDYFLIEEDMLDLSLACPVVQIDLMTC